MLTKASLKSTAVIVREDGKREEKIKKHER
jgi:hypothetical protein